MQRTGYQNKYLVPGMLFLLFVFVMVFKAWLCDDAYITLRTIDNFVHGYGLRWNVAERVQTYTNPLWMLLLTVPYAVTGEAFYTTMVFSLCISTAAVLLLVRASAGTRAAAVALLALMLSKPFVEYSTSGLENPLVHLLLAGFYLVYIKEGPSHRRLLHLSLLTALLGVTRLDALVLLAPALGYEVWRIRDVRGVAYAAAGMLPLVLWEAFSVIYYGFPFPNTAYTKLFNGMPLAELANQGLFYVFDSLVANPLTLVLVLVAAIVSAVRRDRGALALCAGAWLYLAYVICIGGDFMSGRFFTAPFFLSVLVLSRMRFSSSRAFTTALTGIALLAVAGSRTTLPMADPDGDFFMGIADEQKYYAGSLGLFTYTGDEMDSKDVLTDTPDAIRHERSGVYLVTIIGLRGFYAGPGKHIVDRYALADPLLARMPPVDKGYWRPGHLERRIPEGFLETIRDGTSRFSDRRLAEYYARLSVVTSGDLFTKRRFREIWNFNTGKYDHLIDRAAYSRPASRSGTSLSVLSTP